MDLELAAVAETLAHEYSDIRSGTVVRVLTECVSESPHADPHFIEQAARARLSLLGPSRRFQARARGPLDVSLHDRALAEEVELTALLMVAANESPGPLPPGRVDEVLGVDRRTATVIPLQGAHPARESVAPAVGPLVSPAG